MDFIRLFIEEFVVHEYIFQDCVSKNIDFIKFIPCVIPRIFLHDTNHIEIYITSNIHHHSVCAHMQLKFTNNIKNVNTNVRFNVRLTHCSIKIEK